MTNNSKAVSPIQNIVNFIKKLKPITLIISAVIILGIIAGAIILPATASNDTSSFMLELKDVVSAPAISLENNYRHTPVDILKNPSSNLSVNTLLGLNLLDSDKKNETALLSTLYNGGSIKNSFTPPLITSAVGDYQGLIAEYKQYNSEVIGYIDIPGTNVNYPVACNTSNINYYTHLDIYKQPSRNGCIWAHNYNRFGSVAELSNNTVLFGHNWTNIGVPAVDRPGDVMFAPITAYEYTSYLQQHPYINFSIAGANLRWQVFATFYIDINTSFGMQYINTNISDVAAFAQNAKALSTTNINVPVGAGDKILTLSTCTRRIGGLGNQQRFVVMAKLVQ